MEMKENALFRKGLKTGMGTRIALGLGLIILGPAIASLAGKIVRPAARAAMRGGNLIYQEVRKIAREAEEAEQPGASEDRAMVSSKPFDGSEQKQSIGRQAGSQSGMASSGTSASRPQQTERPAPWIVRGY